MPRPVIQDCEGLALTAEEKALYKEFRPFGFILFARNCQSPDQVRKLTTELREAVDRPDAPIFIDQEGGRVCRLNFQHWRQPPSGSAFGRLYNKDPEKALMAARINGRIMAEELRTLGITVNCYPLLDMPVSDADPIIGDRAFGNEVEMVSALGDAACEGLFSGGVLPVIKHIPGHGRATVDSHKSLPVVNTPRKILEKTDFAPFKALNSMPLAMTAHIVYTAIDPYYPATLSESVIRQIIREYMGFTGVLISDDLSMKALSGTPSDKAKQALRAGCDLVIHANDTLVGRRALLENLYNFNLVTGGWLSSLFQPRQNVPNINRDELIQWLDDMLEEE